MRTYPAKKGKRGRKRKEALRLLTAIHEAGPGCLKLSFIDSMTIQRGGSPTFQTADDFAYTHGYRVTCDETNNPQDTIARGELHVDIVVSNPSPEMVAAIKEGWPLGLIIPAVEADTNDC